jgi:hypothetical protein
VPEPRDDDILDPTLQPQERIELLETVRLLEDQRPIPRPAFRGQLARRLRTRPQSPYLVRRLTAAYAGLGFTLLMVVAIGLAGAGPLAA